MKRLLTAVLALTLTGCFSSKGDSNGGGGTPPPPPPPPPVSSIKGVFRAPGTAHAAASVQGVKAQAGAATVSTTMSTPRKYHQGVKLLDGTLLIFGGSSDNNGNLGLASAEVFDPATETFSPVGDMSVPRVSPSGVRLPDGRVAVVGGALTSNVDIYDPQTKTWTTVVVSGTSQDNMYWTPGKLFVLPHNKLLFFGGQGLGAGNPYWNSQIIDLPSGTMMSLIDPLGQRARFASLVLNDGTILVSGGVHLGPGGEENVPLDDIITIDPESLKFSQIGKMTTTKLEHSMLQYPDGLVEIYGGIQDIRTIPLTATTVVETFDPVTKVSIKVGNLAAARIQTQSNILQNGISLHGGGPDETGKLGNTQLTYEHGTNIATITNQMVLPRTYFVSLVMNNGRVLYAGGTVDTHNTVTNTAEIFDSYSLIMLQGSTDAVQLDPVTQGTVQMTLVSGGPVVWSCDKGTITPEGLWTAPLWAEVDNPTKARITATSATDDTVKAAFDVRLLPYEAPVVP